MSGGGRGPEDGMVPWADVVFARDLAALTGWRRQASLTLAEQLVTIAALARRVPRQLGDERGATAWTSLRREVAWAMGITEPAAARQLRHAVTLTTLLPVTLARLQDASLCVPSALLLLDELDGVRAELATAIDTELVPELLALPTWRVKAEIRRAVLRLDADAAADAAAHASAARSVRFSPLGEGQASIELIGPALPAAVFYATLTARATALKATGDPRTLAALRHDRSSPATPARATAPPTPPAPLPPNRAQHQPTRTLPIAWLLIGWLRTACWRRRACGRRACPVRPRAV